MNKPSLKIRTLKAIYDRFIHWRLPQFTHPEYPVVLEYPIRPEPRYGEGKPAHPELAAFLERHVDRYAESLHTLARYAEKLGQIAEAAHAPTPGAPYWENTFFSALDAIALYGMLGAHQPARYLEVGSGNSTKFARRAQQDLGLSTKILSIDPHPRAEIDALCDGVVRQPLEDVGAVHFDQLEAGDILFIDNSHRVFQNSDVTVFFLEVLPRLKSGVIVHIHDIFLPFDYPRSWVDRHYSEQYLLAAFFLADYRRIDVLLPNAYAGVHPVLSKLIRDTWVQPLFQRAFARYKAITGGYLGTSMWLRMK